MHGIFIHRQRSMQDQAVRESLTDGNNHIDILMQQRRYQFLKEECAKG
jgi:hypothetical protein